ncbi:MAG TPA: hypothetical protein VED40_13380 [Azospirillaceae bacterium]|nr:hypothetical protein [Azospirillaceae bacterium]
MTKLTASFETATQDQGFLARLVAALPKVEEFIEGTAALSVAAVMTFSLNAMF